MGICMGLGVALPSASVSGIAPGVLPAAARANADAAPRATAERSAILLADAGERRRLAAIAARTSIIRDDWGIAHVRGRTDADAVFAMMYAQAEDDFPRIEANYLVSLGRTAEADGESAIWADLRQRMFVDPQQLRAHYAASPDWLQRLMTAWADGLNYYLLTHPRVKPRVIARFEPWMALSFTEGSIGGDITKVPLDELEKFYGGKPVAARNAPDNQPIAFVELNGSNGAAISARNSESGNALLLINPHTTFYFRSEAQVTSDEGLNVYGASTWGQFFVYQGFNAHAGWAHTTSSTDTTDEFAEQVEYREGVPYYRYGADWRPVTEERITLRYRTAGNQLAERSFRIFRTHHGPVVRIENGRWISAAIMNRPIASLEQSYLRTKVKDLAGFVDVSRRAANSSNNAVFADGNGAIALLLPTFLPRRDDRFDYTRPVDGADPATDWQGDTALAAIPGVVNPASGWVYNSNDGPWWAAGADSPDRAAYPRYADRVGENARTPNAVRAFGGQRDFTLSRLIDAAYNSWLPAFERLIPSLVTAHKAAEQSDTWKGLAAPVALLRTWNYHWSTESIETSLAVLWGEALSKEVAPAALAARMSVYDSMAAASPEAKLAALKTAVDQLQADFGTWRVSWGELNRFQRLDGALEQHFDDQLPSVAIPYTSWEWGSLAAFRSRRAENTRRRYGWTGNAFVAVVEFGKRVRARAIVPGGQSADAKSPHLNDQVARFATGNLRDVYFYPEDVVRHAVRRYRPGLGAEPGAGSAGLRKGLSIQHRN